MSYRKEGLLVEVRWAINPFRGDRFEEAWTPVAEAALDYGATGWALYRSHEGGLDFIQHAWFDDVEGWERYWYSDEVSAVRAEINGYYQVPLLPVFLHVAGIGYMDPSTVAAAPAVS